MRWRVRIGLVLLLTIGAAAAYGWHRLGALDTPLEADGGSTVVEITPGMSFAAIVDRLHAEGVVRDPLVFELYGRYVGVGSRLKAGTYAVDLGQTPRELLEALEAGTLPPEIRVTLPEGFNRWQIADLLSERGLVDRDAFLTRIERDDLEGRLFPDTYRFRPEAGVDAVVAALTARFGAVMEAVLAQVPAAQRPKTDAERRELLVLASLVEKEARTARDRRLVARVFHNRLARGMKLQTDPTCVYDARWYREVPHPRYCKDPANRYSTYVIDGLPPGPIANPGRDALAATLTPATGDKSAKLLFFVARRDGSGEHHFSETYAEHQRAVRRYLTPDRDRP